MVSSASSMKTAASFAYEVVPLGSPLGSPAPSGGVEGHCGEGHSPSSDAAGGTHGAAEASSGDGFSFVAVTSKESTLSPSRLQAKLSSANNGLNKSRTSEAFSSKLQRVRGRVVLFGVLFMMAFLALKMFFFHDESAPHAEDARAAVWPYSSRNVSPPRLPSEEKAPFSSVNILPESSPPKKYEEVLAPSTSISSSGVREESALTRVDASSTGSRGPSSTVMNGKNIAQDSLRQKCENVLFLSKRPTTPWNYTQILEQEAHSYTNSRKYQVKMREAAWQWEKPLHRPGRSTDRIARVFNGIEKSLQWYNDGKSENNVVRTTEKMEKKNTAVLELGFGAGTNMIFTHSGLLKNNSDNNALVVGVELNNGWVQNARSRFSTNTLQFYQGDITDSEAAWAKEMLQKNSEIDDLKFDVIYLADVWEHIPSYRVVPLWLLVKQFLKPASGILYIHIPSPAKQAWERDHLAGVFEKTKAGATAKQFFENTVTVDEIRKGATCVGLNILKVEEHGSLKTPVSQSISIFVGH